MPACSPTVGRRQSNQFNQEGSAKFWHKKITFPKIISVVLNELKLNIISMQKYFQLFQNYFNTKNSQLFQLFQFNYFQLYFNCIFNYISNYFIHFNYFQLYFKVGPTQILNRQNKHFLFFPLGNRLRLQRIG